MILLHLSHQGRDTTLFTALPGGATDHLPSVGLSETLQGQRGQVSSTRGRGPGDTGQSLAHHGLVLMQIASWPRRPTRSLGRPAAARELRGPPLAHAVGGEQPEQARRLREAARERDVGLAPAP